MLLVSAGSDHETSIVYSQERRGYFTPPPGGVHFDDSDCDDDDDDDDDGGGGGGGGGDGGDGDLDDHGHDHDYDHECMHACALLK